MENRYLTCQDGTILNLSKVECFQFNFTPNFEGGDNPDHGEIECLATVGMDFHPLFKIQYPASHQEYFCILAGEQLHAALSQGGPFHVSMILQSVRKLISTHNGADETMVDALKVMQALLKAHDLPLQERWLRIGKVFAFGGLNAVKLMDDSIAVLSNMCETHLELHANAAAAVPPAAEATTPAPIAISADGHGPIVVYADGFGDWRSGLDRDGIPYSNPTGMSFETDAMHLPRIAHVFDALLMRFQWENATNEHQAVPVVVPNDPAEQCYLYTNLIVVQHWADCLQQSGVEATLVETKEGPAIAVPAYHLEAATDYLDNHNIEWAHDPAELANEEEE